MASNIITTSRAKQTHTTHACHFQSPSLTVRKQTQSVGAACSAPHSSLVPGCKARSAALDWAFPHIWTRMSLRQPALKGREKTGRIVPIVWMERERVEVQAPPASHAGCRADPATAPQLPAPTPWPLTESRACSGAQGWLGFCGVGVGAPWIIPDSHCCPELQPCSRNPSFQMPTGAPAHTRNSADSSQEELGC